MTSMRSLLTTACVSFLLGAQAGAQVTMTSDDMFNLGDFARGMASPDGVTINVTGLIGPTGEQSWNFTGLDALLPRTLRRDFVEVATTDCAADYGAAAFAEEETDEAIPGDTPAWNYYTQTPGVGRTAYGSCLPGSAELVDPAVPFVPPIVDIPDPLNFGDVYSLATVLPTATILGTFDVIQTSTSNVDAWGTINLPGLGVKNCLRICETIEIEILGASNFLRAYTWVAQDAGVVAQIVSEAGLFGLPPAQFTTAEFMWVQFENSLGGDDEPADLNGDGTVGPADLAQLLGSWGPCPGRGDCPADLDGDGTVGPADLALLLGSWG